MNSSGSDRAELVANSLSGTPLVLKLKFEGMPGFAVNVDVYAIFKHHTGTFEVQAQIPQTITEIQEDVEHQATAYHRHQLLAVFQARKKSLDKTRELEEWFKTPFAI